MPTFPLPAKSAFSELSQQRVYPADMSARREVVHELMNQLTVIDLCASQLRATDNPLTLATLEKAVDSAIRMARHLAAECSAPTAHS
jgi:hypothetical protein